MWRWRTERFGGTSTSYKETEYYSEPVYWTKPVLLVSSELYILLEILENVLKEVEERIREMILFFFTESILNTLVEPGVLLFYTPFIVLVPFVSVRHNIDCVCRCPIFIFFLFTINKQEHLESLNPRQTMVFFNCLYEQLYNFT